MYYMVLSFLITYVFCYLNKVVYAVMRLGKTFHTYTHAIQRATDKYCIRLKTVVIRTATARARPYGK